MTVTAARRDVLDLTRDAVVPGDCAAVDDIRIQRVGRDVSVLFGAHRMPLAKRDLAVVAAARDAHRPALLLAAVDPVWKLVVGDDVVELRGRLVVPGAPGLAVIHADGGALVDGQEDDIGVVGIDPDGVIVVTAGRAFDGRKTLAGVGGAVSGCVGDIHHVAVLGIDADAGEVRAAAVDALLVVDAAPGAAGVVGAIEPAGIPPGFHQGVHPVGVAGRDADADAAGPRGHPLGEGGQPAGKLVPGVAAVGGLEQPAVRPRECAVSPRTLPRLPQHRINDLRIAGVEGEIRGARMLIFIEHLLPVLTAIRGAEDAALGIRPIGMPQDRHEDAIGIVRIHQNGRYLLAVAQAEVAPGLAGVGGLVHAIAHRKVGSLQAFAATHIDDVGVGRRYGYGADGAGGLVVEDRLPGETVIVALPHPAVVDPDVKDVGLVGNARSANGAATAERPNRPPLQGGVGLGIEGLGANHGQQARCDEQ